MRKTFAIDAHAEKFIDDQVECGRFNNASEVVRAGLRLLEDHELQMRRLRSLIDQADAEIAAGQGLEYRDGEALARDVLGLEPRS